MIYPILSHDAPAIWPEVSDYVTRALKLTLGQINADSVLERIKAQDMQLWVIAESAILGAMVTEILIYPNRKILRVVTLGGEGWDNWGSEIVETLDSYAKYVGATGIEFVGRKGWIKKLAQHGYSTRCAYFQKELENVRKTSDRRTDAAEQPIAG